MIRASDAGAGIPRRMLASRQAGRLILSTPGIPIHRTGWNERGTDHLDELRQRAISLGP